jgi:CheY-like chemotaxis protein
MRGEIKLQVSAGRSSKFIRVEVVDTGIGISPEDISKLLKIIQNPFEDVTTRGAAGIGLGMRIAQILLVCLTGGDMDFQIVSEKGSGTTIRFELLRKMKNEGSALGTAAKKMMRAKTKVEEVVVMESDARDEARKDELTTADRKAIPRDPTSEVEVYFQPNKYNKDEEESEKKDLESLASEDDAVEENMSISGDEDRVRQLPAFREDETEADIPKSALEEKIYDQPPPTLAAGFIGQIQTRLVKKKMYTGKVRLRNSTTHSSQGMLKQAQSIASSSKGKRSSIRGSNRDVNIKLTRNYDKQQSTHISNFLGSELDTGKYNTHTMADMLQPRRNRESIMIEPADDDYDATRRKVALVVDDEVINADILQGWLEQLGLEVFVAYEGELAVELCNRLLTLGKPVDVIFLDYSMPLMNGDECTKALRSSQFDPILKETKIVGLTAHRDPDIREKCLEAGMDVVEYKPILMDKVRSILTRLEIIEE